MATFGAMNPQVNMMNKLLPPRGPMVYPSGLKEQDKGNVRFGPKSTDYPNLIIVNPISDDDGNIILPGYYELVLSYDRTMLSLMQAGKEIAKVPVFKIDIDKNQEQKSQPMDSKSQKAFVKAQKKKENQRKKLIKQGKIPDVEESVYSNASIEYVADGDYYLIKYERGKIRAWGAIK